MVSYIVQRSDCAHIRTSKFWLCCQEQHQRSSLFASPSHFFVSLSFSHFLSLSLTLSPSPPPLSLQVDRSVTGLVAQQQCVGPLQLPLANCAVLAQSHFTRQGIATAVGEQPIKGLLSPAAMARLTVG